MNKPVKRILWAWVITLGLWLLGAPGWIVVIAFLLCAANHASKLEKERFQQGAKS